MSERNIFTVPLVHPIVYYWVDTTICHCQPIESQVHVWGVPEKTMGVFFEAILLPFAHDGRVIVGVDEICMVGQPAHAEDSDHATKHLHYLKIVNMKLEGSE